VIGGRLIGVIAGTCSVTLTVTSPTGTVSSKKLNSVIY
jgi:PKD repeat protein